MNPKKTAKAPRCRVEPPTRPVPNYYLREGDVERIDCMISQLGLAISQIFACREIRENPVDEMEATQEYESQIDLVLQEADRQLQFQWGYPSDF